MQAHRPTAAWLRFVAGLIALAGLLGLTACGGGSGAPNNPYAPTPSAPSPIVVLPTPITVYSRTPATLTVTGGVPPYYAYSSNSAVLPVAQAVSGNTLLLVANDVSAATSVTVTIQDSIGQTAAAGVTVSPAPLLPNLVTITPNNDCKVSAGALGGAVCSGGTGTASVRLTGPGGAPLANRQVRFEVVQGDFAIQSSNPSTPLVSALTVVSDVNGNAVVGIAVPTDAMTQVAIIRATDLMTGNQVSGQFTIAQVTDGAAVLSIIPTGTTKITGPSKGVCSTGVRVSYYIFGGTPPYTVGAAYPDAVLLVGVPVLTNGGHFDAITNGSCFVNMQFKITDATGRTLPATATLLTNEEGTATPPAPTAMTIAPSTISVTACAGKTVQFTVTGGTQPYSANFALAPAVSPAPVKSFPTPNVVSIAFGATPVPAGTIGTLTLTDSSTPQLSTTATLTCN